MWRTGNLYALLVEKDVQHQESCKMALPLGKTVCQFLTKLKTKLPYEPAIPFLDIHPKELKVDSQRHLYNHVPNSIIHNSQKSRSNLIVH